MLFVLLEIELILLKSKCSIRNTVMVCLLFELHMQKCQPQSGCQHTVTYAK